MAGSVCTSVPPFVSPITLVTLASSPSGAPGAGALAITSPTAALCGAPGGVGEAAGEEGDEVPGGTGLLGSPGRSVRMARRVRLSYEPMASPVLWARCPEPAGRAVADAAVVVVADAAATASE